MTVHQKEETKQSYYADSYSHIKDELYKLDLIIQRRVLIYRLQLQTMQKNISSQRMYISHEEVDWLLTQPNTTYAHNVDVKNIEQQIKVFQKSIDMKVQESIRQGIFLTLCECTRLFSLSDFEVQVIIICLAPELDRKYDKLYAYLQDDITRKRPSIDLALDLLCRDEAEQWRMRCFFSDSAPLIRANILHEVNDPQSPSGSSNLSQFLQLDKRILNYILGHNNIDAQLLKTTKVLKPLISMEEVFVDPILKTKLFNFTKQYFSVENPDRKCAILHFYGPYGIGKKELAGALCGELHYPLISFDMESLYEESSDREKILRLAFREGLLLQGALYLDNIDTLLNDNNNTKAFAKTLMQICYEYGWLTFLAGEKPWQYKGLFDDIVFLSVGFTTPDVPLSTKAWGHAIDNSKVKVEEGWADQLANQFRLTPGQIKNAVRLARTQTTMDNNEKNITLDDFNKASRYQSNHTLGELALKIDTRYEWKDIVLPEDKITQLKEICSQVKYRYQVFSKWGFDEKVTHGKGLSVLFSGPSGTGKTMAAEVIAHALNLDLYKIDLSGVVSKYIGETEKNLSRIFKEAETSNAILFFDEADALFGKRTEISDAHDRYANIETSYLLQKMEEYEGIVILATNLRDNMDEAFTRRIRFIVEFPFPDEESRMKIWQIHFPHKAPLSKEIDYTYLSKQFQIAGGNIKNIVLNAAFLAADNEGVIGMEHIFKGAKREFEKIGKLWDEKSIVKS